jgi:hypothetical protein
MTLLVRAVAVVMVVAVMSGCQASPRRPLPATTIPTTTVAKKPPRKTTTTTRALPPSPQSSPDAAATVFMQGWIAGNRAQSASVGTGGAVATLFATPYAQQPVVDRGCSDAFAPIRCSWGPYGGGSGDIYEVTLASTASGGWYVSGVTIES